MEGQIVKAAVTVDNLVVTIHMPKEAKHNFYLAFGWPDYHDTVPVAIARLLVTQQAPSSGVLDTRDESLNETQGPSTRMNETDTRTTPASEKTTAPGPNHLAQHIAILCNDVRFQQFLFERHGCIPIDEAAAEFVRRVCGVRSRADILPGTKAEQAWNLIESAYLAETH